MGGWLISHNSVPIEFNRHRIRPILFIIPKYLDDFRRVMEVLTNIESNRCFS